VRSGLRFLTCWQISPYMTNVVAQDIKRKEKGSEERVVEKAP
jgi:hypothetical protein